MLTLTPIPRFFALTACSIALLLPWSLPAQTAVETAPSATTPTKENSETPADEKDAGKKKKRKKVNSEDFMRVRRNRAGKQVALETSITRYEKVTEDGKRITVDLIGAVHIGEKDYFEALNKRFEQYEDLLYELVAPEGTVIPKGGRDGGSGIPTNPLAAMQKGMQAALGLEFQLEHIDYNKDNFTHADMTPEEFAQSMTANDESFLKIGLRAIGQSMAMQAAQKGDSGVGMLMALFSQHKEIRMRREFAKQMKQMDAGMIAFEGKNGSTILDHRNAKCMKVLRRQIDAGKRNIGIFYGAAHLPDMERRLLEEFEMKRAGKQWLKAWSLAIPKKK